jgi:hypothetical protein
MIQRRNDTGVKRGSGVVLTGNTVYLHTLVQRNASGKIANATDNTTARCVGLAVQNNDMSTSGTILGDGTLVCEFEWGFEVLLPLLTAVTVGNTGATAYAKDNFTIGCTGTTNGSSCGVLEEFVAANSGWVSIRGASAVTKGT